MTELQHYQGPPQGVVAMYPGQPPAPVAPPPTVQSLQAWAESARAAHTVAQSLVTTSFVPEAFRGKPHEATAAILAGDEVGLSPMASLRSFDVIQGTAAARALTLRAIVQSKGHDIWTVESTDSRAIVHGRRAGSDQVHKSEWTIQRAKGLQLTGKKNWREQPKAMLIARATAECCRMVAADAILGIPYAVEELADGADEKPAGKRTMRRATAAVERPPAAHPAAPPAAASGQPEPAGPPLPGEDGYDDEPTPATDEQDYGDREADHDGITKAQSSKLHAIFTRAGYSGPGSRGDRLRAVSGIVGRELASSTELTKQEASVLIDTLEQLAEAGDLSDDVDQLLTAVQTARQEREAYEDYEAEQAAGEGGER